MKTNTTTKDLDLEPKERAALDLFAPMGPWANGRLSPCKRVSLSRAIMGPKEGRRERPELTRWDCTGGESGSGEAVKAGPAEVADLVEGLLMLERRGALAARASYGTSGYRDITAYVEFEPAPLALAVAATRNDPNAEEDAKVAALIASRKAVA